MRHLFTGLALSAALLCATGCGCFRKSTSCCAPAPSCCPPPAAPCCPGGGPAPVQAFSSPVPAPAPGCNGGAH